MQNKEISNSERTVTATYSIVRDLKTTVDTTKNLLNFMFFLFIGLIIFLTWYFWPRYEWKTITAGWLGEENYIFFTTNKIKLECFSFIDETVEENKERQVCEFKEKVKIK